jgi:hypothetical protein
MGLQGLEELRSAHGTARVQENNHHSPKGFGRSHRLSFSSQSQLWGGGEAVLLASIQLGYVVGSCPSLCVHLRHLQPDLVEKHGSHPHPKNKKAELLPHKGRGSPERSLRSAAHIHPVVFLDTSCEADSGVEPSDLRLQLLHLGDAHLWCSFAAFTFTTFAYLLGHFEVFSDLLQTFSVQTTRVMSRDSIQASQKKKNPDDAHSLKFPVPPSSVPPLKKNFNLGH